MDKVVTQVINKSDPCTILLPLFNGAKFLSKSIENICAMAGPNDEILIVDDGSTDLTNHEIESFCKQDSRIVVHFCQHRGLVETLNYGIKAASHELIARADIDDTYDPTRIRLQANFLTSNPDISAVFSDYKMVSISGANLGMFPSAILPELTSFSLISSQRTAHPSVMYRKSAVIAAGGYQTDDYPAEDLGLWIRLVQKGNIATIPKVLLNYTIHANSITRSNQMTMRTKSLELRKQFASQEENLLTLNRAKEHLLQYKEFPYRNLRILFFLEDLINYNRLTNQSYQRKIMLIVLYQVITRNIFLLIALIQVLAMKLRRFYF